MKLVQDIAHSEHSCYYFIIIQTFTNTLNFYWNLLFAKSGAWCWQYLDEIRHRTFPEKVTCLKEESYKAQIIALQHNNYDGGLWKELKEKPLHTNPTHTPDIPYPVPSIISFQMSLLPCYIFPSSVCLLSVNSYQNIRLWEKEISVI